MNTQRIFSDYEVVIGLEVHVHLDTEAKLFTSCPVSYGAEPNTRVSEVCLALPGTLPVISERAVDRAVRAALVTQCKVHPISVFARKHYFYPDLPKGYQISQFEEPLATGGYIEISDPEDASRHLRIGLTRIHIEEDAGKSIHDPALAGSEVTLIDLNRAGVPLIEIVSEPDLRSPEEAVTYLRTLHRILRYVDVSNVDMEKGQFRCDANISLRPHGEVRFGTRTELKNLNSFRSVQSALHAEIIRQAELLEDGGEVVQATMGYDADRDRVFVMRLKENADDYRYFPDPDLIPLRLSPARIDEIRNSLPELPSGRRDRFCNLFGLSTYDAEVITSSRPLADFFEDVLAIGGETADFAKTVSNWIQRDVLGALRDRDLDIETSSLTPEALVNLLRMVEVRRVTVKSARDLICELVVSGGNPEDLVEQRGLEAVSDASILDTVIQEVLSENPDAISSYRSGEEKSLNFLMGQVMRKTKGKAEASAVRTFLIEKLKVGPT